MTLNLHKSRPFDPPVAIALNPMHVAAVSEPESDDAGCRLVLSSGDAIDIVESYDETRTLWQIALIDLQNLAAWEPEDESDDDTDLEPVASDWESQCLS